MPKVFVLVGFNNMLCEKTSFQGQLQFTQRHLAGAIFVKRAMFGFLSKSNLLG